MENFCLTAGILVGSEDIVATPDPLLIFGFAKGLAKGKLGGVVDTGYLPKLMDK